MSSQHDVLFLFALSFGVLLALDGPLEDVVVGLHADGLADGAQGLQRSAIRKSVNQN